MVNNPFNHLSKEEFKNMQRALEVANEDISFMETLFNIIPNPIFYKNSQGIYKYCNKAFCHYIGYDASAIIDHTVYDIAPINLANIYHQADIDLIQSKETQIYESQVRYADGTLHDVIFHKKAHLNEFKEAIGLVGVMIDITSRKDSERQVQKQNIIKDVLISISHVINQQSENVDFFRMLLHELVESIDAVDYGTVLEINAKKELVIITSQGYDKTLAANFHLPLESCYIWEHSDGNLEEPDIIPDLNIFFKEEYPEHMSTVDGRRVNSCLYIPFFLNDGRHIILSLESAGMGAFNDMDVHIAEYIQLQIPIIHQIFALNKKTLELSRYDNLTGLMNRGYFNTIFDDRLNFARRDKSIISLIMFDLDGLKIINDNFGHAAGDDYLKHFAHFIESQFRSTDTFARIGGDEFLGIFNTTDPLALKKKLSLLQTLYSEMPIDLEETSFTGSFSYGIATYPEDADTTDGLLTVADIKMYLDKKKNRSVHPPKDDEAQ